MVAHSKFFEQYKIVDAAWILVSMQNKNLPVQKKVKRLRGNKNRPVSGASKLLVYTHVIDEILYDIGGGVNFSQAELEEINAIENGLRNL